MNMKDNYTQWVRSHRPKRYLSCMLSLAWYCGAVCLWSFALTQLLASVWPMQYAQLTICWHDQFGTCSHLHQQWESCISHALPLLLRYWVPHIDSDNMLLVGGLQMKVSSAAQSSVSLQVLAVHQCKLLQRSGSMLRHQCICCLTTWLMLSQALFVQRAQPASMLVRNIGCTLFSK